MNLNGGIDSLIERKAVDKEIKRLRSLTSTKILQKLVLLNWEKLMEKS